MSGKYLITVMVIVFLGLFLCNNGSKKSGKESSNDEGAGRTAMLLCIKCGQIKGDELCCKPDQVKCPKCGLAKGSPGCCKIPEGAQIAAICAECNKVIVEKACCGCYDAKCPVEDFAHTHKYPRPKEPQIKRAFED
jgi:hypothetical protein